MKYVNQKSGAGYTIIEMLIVISMITIIATLILANFRYGEDKKKVALAADQIITALRTAQNHALAGKQIDNTPCAIDGVLSKAANEFQVSFTYTSIFILRAYDKCNELRDIQTYTLPEGTQIASDGIKVMISGVTFTEPNSAHIRFRPPFGNMTVVRGVAGTIQPFTTVSIKVESINRPESKTVTIDGISGRIY